MTTRITTKNIHDLFQVNLENFFKAKFALHYHLHMQPSEIENLPYYEFEYILKNLSNFLEEKNKQEKEAYDKQSANTPNMSKYSKQFSKMRPPSIPKISMPRM